MADKQNSDMSGSTGGEEIHPENAIKSKRKLARRRITLSIKRIREIISKGKPAENKRRLEKEVKQLRDDFETARNLHGQLYEFMDEEEFDGLDQWEHELTDDVFSIEEEVENALAPKTKKTTQENTVIDLTTKGHQSNEADNLTGSSKNQGNASENLVGGSNHKDQATNSSTEGLNHQAQAGDSIAGGSNHENNDSDNLASTGDEVQQEESTNDHASKVSMSGSKDVTSLVRSPITTAAKSSPFDAWIDNLVEFQETVLPAAVTTNLTIAEALLKLEASKDIPSITIPDFDGDPLSYTDFVDHFKIHIHDKTHLTDDVRMIQLRMRIKGEAERALAGLGSKGAMYATALKSLKEQFGQPSVIARAVVNKLTKGENITRNNRQALREFSLDITNCLAIMHRLDYYADINANDNLRRMIMRLPANLVEKWKSVVADLREKGEVPSLYHIGEFVRKRVRAEFDPDFGDIQDGMRSQKSELKGGQTKGGRGVHSTQRSRPLKCHICQGSHVAPECPTLADSTVNERFEFVTNAKLCFSCLGKGHMTRDCRTKKLCGRNGCHHYHHPLLHADPSTASGVASVLDKNGILPIVRVRFRAANGRYREGNVLIDSGAATTVIRQEFARALGLQGKRERIDLAVVSGERIEQSESRRVKFWISPLGSSEEFAVEAHEIKKTIFSIPPLDRQWLHSFSYLRDLNFPHKAGPVDLILGVQYTHLHAEDEIRQGLPFEPVAKKTKLRWLVIGSDNHRNSNSVCAINLVQPLNLEKFYEFETLGVQARDCPCPKVAISRQDKEAIELMESSCKLEDSRYTIGLPWKKDKSLLPNNYPLAEKRLISLERNLLKDEAKARMYDEAIMEYEKNG